MDASYSSSRPKKLNYTSYTSLKSVLKFLSVKKREQIHIHIPELRSVNALLPYAHEEVILDKFEIMIQNRSYLFKKLAEKAPKPEGVARRRPEYEYAEYNRLLVMDLGPPSLFDMNDLHHLWRPMGNQGPDRLSFGDLDSLEKRRLRFRRENRLQDSSEHGRTGNCEITISEEDGTAITVTKEIPVDIAYEKIFDAFFSNGSRIKLLKVQSFPDFLMRKDLLTLKVREIDCSSTASIDILELAPFLDHSSLKKLTLNVTNTNVDLLMLPLVQNCPVLRIVEAGTFLSRMLKTTLLSALQNQKLEIFPDIVIIESFPQLVQSWATSSRPIGSLVQVGIREDYKEVLDILDFLKESHGAHPAIIKKLENTDFSNGLSMLIDGDLELAIYGGGKISEEGLTRPQPCKWSLCMEVMKRGDTIPR
ncbi:F-box C protein [Caenorhabditis elegans]|uniref:F-box C protein n=1 Tax=Caenorhabditis elegans TaxID=6239 RepID=O44714_CAEEL|nr:F-box C protein [Caenorhabditis elegans]CCD67473.1 F-box C protein [Caenorhabditis elegans]|eukprot:NP_494625.1 F-box C protein [Caenorhabditis elegans]